MPNNDFRLSSEGPVSTFERWSGDYAMHHRHNQTFAITCSVRRGCEGRVTCIGN